MRIESVIASAVLLTCAACPDRTIGAVDIDPSRVERVELPSETNAEIDLLFVIDNSLSMDDEQESLADNFDDFIAALRNAEGGLPDLHIGVVTSDMGTMGGNRFIPPDGSGGCNLFGDGGGLRMPDGVATAKYLEDLRPLTAGGPRRTNHGDRLVEAFRAAATVGTTGCNFEAHLMSMKRALDTNQANAGFLRPNAYLAVVFIADEDDCSVAETGQAFFAQSDLQRNASSFICFRASTVCEGDPDPSIPGDRTNCRPRENSPLSASVDGMVSFLKSIKPESQLIVAGIYGDLKDVITVERRGSGTLDILKSCDYAGSRPQSARSPVRLDAFVRQFRNHVSTSICLGDLAGPMQQIARLVNGVTGTRCFQGRLADPPYCSVSDVIDPFGPDRSAQTIPQCDPAHSRTPCWTLGEDLQACPTTETHVAVNIDRGTSLPPSNSRVFADCVTE
jgi:hypothetical protein